MGDSASGSADPCAIHTAAGKRISSMLGTPDFYLGAKMTDSARQNPDCMLHAESAMKASHNTFGGTLTSLSQLLCRLATKPLQIGLSAVRILPQLLRLLLNPLQADHHSLLRVY